MVGIFAFFKQWTSFSYSSISLLVILEVFHSTQFACFTRKLYLLPSIQTLWNILVPRQDSRTAARKISWSRSLPYFPWFCSGSRRTECQVPWLPLRAQWHIDDDRWHRDFYSGSIPLCKHEGNTNHWITNMLLINLFTKTPGLRQGNLYGHVVKLDTFKNQTSVIVE